MVARAALEVNGMMLSEAEYPGQDLYSHRHNGPVSRHYLLPHLRSDLELVAASTPRRMSSLQPSHIFALCRQAAAAVRQNPDALSEAHPALRPLLSTFAAGIRSAASPELRSSKLCSKLRSEARSQLCAACRRRASHDEHTPSYGGVGAVRVFQPPFLSHAARAKALKEAEELDCSSDCQ